MKDKQPLSSEQALDDYFFDLLIEPEEVEPEPEPDLPEEPLPAVDDEALTSSDDTGGGEIAAEETGSDETDSGAAPDSEADPEPLDPAPEAVSEPFDFGQLSGQDEELADDGLDVVLDFSPPAGKMLGWVPQVQKQELEPKSDFLTEAEAPAAFAEQPREDLEGVQRLLSQLSEMQVDIQHESDALIATQTEADFLAVSEQECAQEQAPSVQGEACAEAVDSSAIEHVAVLPPSEPQVEPEYEQVLPEPESGEPEVAVAPETQPGGDEPPDQWQQQQAMGDEFQALFFEVNGVTFAVPLTELGGIHQLGDVNRLLGRPPWYLGLMTSREHQLDVVDTARWVMPEKIVSDDHQEHYRYIVMLGESKWGLACNALHGTETLTEQSVRWREKAGKRPWLAGMVKEKMCALIHVSELISMLSAGLDVKSVI